MSLITTASPWLNEDTKKRIPTIPRKSLSSVPSSSPTSSYSQPSISQPSSFTPVESPNILTEPMEEYQEKENPTQPQTEDNRTSKINDMIKKMTVDNAGNGLADFKPLENPVMTTKKTDVLGTSGIPYNSTYSEAPTNTLYPQQQQYNQRPSTQFSENTMDLGNLSSYKQSYEIPQTTTPYYTKFGISNNSTDEKLNDRLSYITHLLEEMQSEKTSNISEEFVMYSMLGIFVIYIVDAFSRTGKYTR